MREHSAPQELRLLCSLHLIDVLASDEDVAHVQHVETQYNLFDATPLHAAAFDGAAVKELNRPLNAVSYQTLDLVESCSA